MQVCGESTALPDLHKLLFETALKKKKFSRDMEIRKCSSCSKKKKKIVKKLSSYQLTSYLQQNIKKCNL